MAQREPGVIVRTTDDTGVIAPPSFQRYPVIIGVGDPYKQISNTKIVRGSGSTDTIPTVTSVNSIVQIGDLPGIAKYVATTDYTLGTNAVDCSPGGDEPTAGNTYYLTTTQTLPASAYTATLYFDMNKVYEDHGGKVRTDGSNNELVIGTKLAFDNGAKGVMVVQLDPTAWSNKYTPTGAEMETSFTGVVDVLSQITDYKCLLVGLSSGTLNTTNANTILFNHAVLASQPETKQERTVLGVMPASTSYTTYATTAESFDHERISISAIPTTCEVTGVSGTFDTRMAVCALAGKLCSVPIGQTIHGEIMSNVTFTDNFTPAEREYLLQHGVSPMRSNVGIVRNVMCITTDTTSALTEDMGVQDIKDYTKKAWRDFLWDRFRNKPINNDTPTDVEDASIDFMEYQIGENIIADFDNISCSRSDAEPRQLNVTGRVLPVFGTAWIDVNFTFVTSLT